MRYGPSVCVCDAPAGEGCGKSIFTEAIRRTDRERHQEHGGDEGTIGVEKGR